MILKSRHMLITILLLILAISTVSGAGTKEAPGDRGAPLRLRLATTTSTENSGLLDVLLPPFEKTNHVVVDVVAVGTGQALQIGRNGDADVLMVHAPDLEEQFVADGYGIERIYFMYNDFIILGPENDPAGIRGMKTAEEAFAAIAGANAEFISRGDNSGTHVKELDIWKKAGVVPSSFPAYREVGQGMGAVITITGDRSAYTLADRGTWLSYVSGTNLKILVEGDPELFNPYGVIALNPERHPHVKVDLAVAFTKYVQSPEGRAIIDGFRISGEQLFFSVK